MALPVVLWWVVCPITTQSYQHHPALSQSSFKTPKIVAQTLVQRSVLLTQLKCAYYFLLDMEKAVWIYKRIGREIEEKEILKVLFKDGTMQQ
eukprot:8349650-Ditylum_brightwellii.AAC.1